MTTIPASTTSSYIVQSIQILFISELKTYYIAISTQYRD